MQNSVGADPVSVLIVDDRRENRFALRAVLESSGYRLVEAASGTEALKCLLKEEFAVLLLDVVMPGMSGFELASIVKQREQTAQIPILFLSAEATDLELVFEGYTAGAVDYLVKPLVPEMVRAKVAVFVDLYRQRKHIERQGKLLLEAARYEGEVKLLETRLAAERRFRRLAEAVPHIIWTARADGTIEYFNRRWFSYTGISTAEAGGDLCPSLHPGDRSGLRAAWEQATRTGQPLEIECRLCRSEDQSYRWHLCRALPEPSQDGESTCWLGTFTDIEAQKQHYTVLAELKGTLDAVNDAVVIFDAETWRVLYVSEGAAALLGYSREELLRLRPADLMPEFNEERLRALLESRAESSSAGIAIETSYRRRDGSDIPVEASLQRISVNGGRVVSIGRDITGRKRAQEERERLFNQALDAVRARDEFLSIASHELRTPLTTLRLNIEALKEQLTREGSNAPDLAGRTEQKLSLATRQIHRLNRLVENVTDVSRMGTGRFRLERGSVDLAGLARDLAGRMSEDARRARCTIDVQAEHDVVGLWDAARLEQVLMNLLSNAMKFGAGRPIEVAVTGDVHGARVTVSDHGIGIPAEAQRRVFDRFERAVSSAHYGGLGLGLYIAREIVRAHGGTIDVTSAPDGGTTFTIDLPRSPDTAAEQSAPEPMGAQPIA